VGEKETGGCAERERGIYRFGILDLGLWKRKRVRSWEDEKVGNVRLEFVSS